MRMTQLWVVPVLAAASIGAGFGSAPTAGADCVNAGNSTICSQGEVRGSNSGPGAGWTGPAYPSGCVDDWYCFDDDWGWDIDVSPPPGGWDPGLPGRPGNRPGIGR